MRKLCRLSLIVIWTVAHGQAVAQQARAAQSDNHLAEMLGLMASAAAQTPALRKQAAAYSLDELISALAAHGAKSRRAGTIKDAEAKQLPADLRVVYAKPDAAALLQWLAPADIKTVAQFFDDWRAELKIDGAGKDATYKVEPLEAIFATRLEAAPIADWLVLSDSRPYGSLILYNPTDSGPKCCRVLDVPGTGSSLPTAYGNLREHLEFEWLTAELVARRAASKL